MEESNPEDDDTGDFLSTSLKMLELVALDYASINNNEDRVHDPLRDDPVLRGRKPRWWRQLSRKASKSQRRAIHAVENFIVRRPAYGTFIKWQQLFEIPSDSDVEVWWEIGFGSGENLFRLAEQYSGSIKRFIGSEVHAPGMGAAASNLQKALVDGKFWKGYRLFISEEAQVSNAQNQAIPDTVRPNQALYSNLRLCPSDAIKFLPHVPSDSVAVVLITNPDPFDRDPRFRIIQVHTLLPLHRILIRCGRLFLATDDEGFFTWSHQVVDELNKVQLKFRPVIPCPDRQTWLPVISTYEQKGRQAGRQERIACWEAVKDGT